MAGLNSDEMSPIYPDKATVEALSVPAEEMVTITSETFDRLVQRSVLLRNLEDAGIEEDGAYKMAFAIYRKEIQDN